MRLCAKEGWSFPEDAFKSMEFEGRRYFVHQKGEPHTDQGEPWPLEGDGPPEGDMSDAPEDEGGNLGGPIDEP
jgi:hypothetical protein